MSGFVGWVQTDGAPIDRALLAQMTGAMAFRGPDALGAWSEGPIGLGLARLRTTFEAAQERGPASLDGKIWLVGDIRLSRRRALIEQLRGRSLPVAHDLSDADLLLHAYAAWGERCVDHLLGDFAFALWDGDRRTLFAARDHFGIAQFFYVQGDNTLLVGNTLQSMLLHPAVPAQLDEQSLLDCALFGMFQDADATAYQAVRRLPPGHCLRWDAAGMRVAPYWTPGPAPAIDSRPRPTDVVEQFRTLFDDTVADCLRTDRAGLHLSGGMDSSSIAVTLKRLLAATGRPFELCAYTMVYRDLIPDEEGAWAVQVAQAAGIAQEFIVTEDVLGEPPPSPVWLPPEPGASYRPGWDDAAEKTARFARVLFTGFGGDALLAAPPLTTAMAAAALRRGAFQWTLRSTARRLRDHRRSRQASPRPEWLNPAAEQTDHIADRQALRRERSQRSAEGMVSAALWRTIFAWSDPGFTGRPLVMRFPFFDKRLFDFVRTLPPYPWLVNKQLLRSAMAERLPLTIVKRPKTPLQANPKSALYARTGVPAWESAALASPAMAPYVAPTWLAAMNRLAPEARAAAWAAARPPVELAYWLQYHRASPAPDPGQVVQFQTFSSSGRVVRETSHAVA